MLLVDLVDVKLKTSLRQKFLDWGEADDPLAHPCKPCLAYSLLSLTHATITFFVYSLQQPQLDITASSDSPGRLIDRNCTGSNHEQLRGIPHLPPFSRPYQRLAPPSSPHCTPHSPRLAPPTQFAERIFHSSFC